MACLVHVLFAMGEYLESLFARQHNQLRDVEQRYVDQYKNKIVDRITHVVDCEAYTLSKTHYLREISIHRICDNQTFSYQVYTPDLYLCGKNVAYQVKHIHGLPQVHTRRTEDFLLYSEVLKLLRDEFLARADLVAYKGGVIERDLLKCLGTKGINLEILGCEKYSNLITKYGISSVRCRYHNAGDYHCSRHEVQVFSHFLQDIL
jgi:hypothetical protein